MASASFTIFIGKRLAILADKDFYLQSSRQGQSGCDVVYGPSSQNEIAELGPSMLHRALHENGNRTPISIIQCGASLLVAVNCFKR